MARLSKDHWLDLRAKWEADPKLSYSDLASDYKISRQAVTSKARRECWEKTGDLAVINREATRRAYGLPNVDRVDETLPLKKDVWFDEAVDKRSDILIKHRGQIITVDGMQDEARSLFDQALAAKMTAENATDDQKVRTAKNLWWQAKIAADVVKDHCAATRIKHDAERKAWGLDELTLSREDLESMTKDELNSFKGTGKLPVRLRKIC